MARLMMVVLWPSFLVAIVSEGCFFSLFDPNDLSFVGNDADLTPVAAYTIGFFFFWAFCALASLLSCYLLGLPQERLPQDQRPST